MKIIFQLLKRYFLGLVLLLALLGGAGLLYLESTLPSANMLKDMRLQVPLRIFSKDNKLIAEFGEGRRTPIPLSEMPKDLINAILATEDRRFYEHPGVDFRGLGRAAVTLLTHSSIKQGGSTITMQVARNFFLSRKKTFTRKLSEILLALKIEKGFTKDEILELYLNKIYFGKRAYGVSAAAEAYYGVAVSQLTLDQMAMLAGLPQAPSNINPLHDPQAAFKRRKHVLDRMLTYHFITEAQYKKAVQAPLPTKYLGRTVEVEAPYVAEMVRQELFARYGESIYELGYEVYTTLESGYQHAANQALKRALLEYDQRHGFRKPQTHFTFSIHKTVEKDLEQWKRRLQKIPSFGPLVPGVVVRMQDTQIAVLLQDGRYIDIPWSGLSWARPQLKGYRLGALPKKASDIVSIGDVIYAQPMPNQHWKLSQVPEVGGALVALKPVSGEILALVGGFDYSLSSFNRVTQAHRQPGSNFKPFVYAAALSEGYTLSSVINDAPLIITDPKTHVTWRPQNDSKTFYGPTRLRLSLARSQNMVTIRLLQAIGIPKFIAFAEKFGFNASKFPPYLSMALGTPEITPLELAAGYCVFANGGNKVSPSFIHTIKDYHGKLIYEAPAPVATRTLGPELAFLMTSTLQDAIQRGTGQRAKSLGRTDLAGKTGTTNDWMDAWYSGYNANVIATAWVGFDEPKTLREYGSMAALPMWMYFMDEALKGKPEHPILPPAGIVSLKVDPDTGLLAHENKAEAINEFFLESNAPSSTGHPEISETMELEAEPSIDTIETLF